ncbi:MAG: PLP-dependent transferase [Clostridia bacterium]|nr:PLP-dependent transferase [Clostridia bacterium]
MNTPICDFVRDYAASGTARLHMPGHKGAPVLGMEALDITEINGADSLYEAEGIIAESERNASALFGADTFYSTEGSSQCIRAMLYLAVLHARGQGIMRPTVAAGRNAHKTFLSAAALLDLDVTWLYPEAEDSYLSCAVTAPMLERLFEHGEKPVAVYLTSPDYLGNTVDIAAIAEVCHQYDVLLLVDNAHGAYLKFLSPSRHPMDLGADVCCDSAHKTLPVLTGGAYLHISRRAPKMLAEEAKRALAMFGSTSPSYLILQSLDAANRVLAEGYGEALSVLSGRVADCRARLEAHGFACVGDEPIKLTLCPKPYGYTGTALAQCLRERGIECEFADPDYLVLMFTPATTEADFVRLTDVLLSLPRREAITALPPAMGRPVRVISVRDATFSPCETVPAAESAGRILAAATVGCPPAVPIVVSGERIDGSAVAQFAYYGMEHCVVVKE